MGIVVAAPSVDADDVAAAPSVDADVGEPLVKPSGEAAVEVDEAAAEVVGVEVVGVAAEEAGPLGVEEVVGSPH